MKNILLASLLVPLLNLYAQTGTLTGTVMSQGEVLPWATIQLKDTRLGCPGGSPWHLYRDM